MSVSMIRAKAPELYAAAHCGDGYSFSEVAARHGYRAVAGWGRDGWDLLDWPHYMLFVKGSRPDGVFDLLTYCEGDLWHGQYIGADDLYGAIDVIAFDHWKHQGEEWVEKLDAANIPEHLRGPYSPGTVA